MAQTASLKAVTTELRKRMGYIPTSGDSNCRPKRINGELRPDKGYSEHAFDNAEDLTIRGYAAQQPYVAELERMRGEGYPVGLVLWAGVRADHTDHIHVEGAPALSTGGAVPPCAGGPAQDKNRKGTTEDSVFVTGVGGTFGSWLDSIQEAFNNTVEGKPGGIQSIPGEVVHRQLIIPIVFSLIAVVAIVITALLISKGLAEKSGIVQVVKDVAK